MAIKEALTRQKILAQETFLYLKRNFSKYIFNAVGLWFWIFKLNIKKGDAFRSTYYSMRNPDDVLDGDRNIGVDPLVYAQSLIESIQNDAYDSEKHPILLPLQFAVQYLEKVKKEHDEPKSELIQLIESMMDDHQRMEIRKELPNTELQAGYAKQFNPILNLQLILLESSLRIADIPEFPLIQARIYSLSDLKNDWTKGLINIPREILQEAGIDPKTASYEEVISSPEITKWRYHECVECSKMLAGVKSNLAEKLASPEEKYIRTIMWGLIIGIENSIKKETNQLTNFKGI